MNLNLLDEESIQPSEPTPCDFFKGENAIKKAKQLGLPDLELVRNAIMIGEALLQIVGGDKLIIPFC
ncbi:hypothetical protein ACG9Y7_21395 [Acinetobacter gerneri]|uniref:hypothetical protein n=1 Tax=Acinetobacter gerneri TaxID=202952 RepID=UPI003AF75EE6